MKSGPTYKLAFRRRREEKTNYRKRLAALKSNIPRFVVRKSLSHIRVGIMGYNPKGDVTHSSCSSTELKKAGWALHCGNIPAAYLTGYLAGKKALARKIREGVADIGLITPVHGSVVFACIKGIRDAGINIPCDESAFPSEERVKGKHIEAYAQSLSDEAVKKQFAGYIRNKVDPRNFSAHVEETMTKIREMK